MRYAIIFLLFPSLLMAEGQIYRNRDRDIKLEFNNVYQDIREKQRRIPTRTKAQLQALSPSTSNLLYICSDCTTHGLVISTGTTVGAFGSATSKTTTIN
jgi:hypothetical protein